MPRSDAAHAVVAVATLLLLAAKAVACPAADELQRALALINAQRGAGTVCGGELHAGSPALAWSEPAAATARGHAAKMAAKRSLAHQDAAGRDGGQRLADAGLRWSAWAENLARGRISVDALVALWFASPGHCANMMLPRLSQAGLGCATAAGGDDYWVLLLWQPERVNRATGPAIATAQTRPAAAPMHD